MRLRADAALPIDELAQASAKPQRRGVDRDIDVRRMRGREALLYGIENGAIFLESAAHAVGQLSRGLRIIGQDIAHLKPIVSGLLIIHGGQEIVGIHDEGRLVMFCLRTCGARRDEYGLDERMTRITNFVMLQAIACTGETNEGNIDGRDVDFAHPAKRGHAGRVGTLQDTSGRALPETFQRSGSRQGEKGRPDGRRGAAS